MSKGVCFKVAQTGTSITVPIAHDPLTGDARFLEIHHSAEDMAADVPFGFLFGPPTVLQLSDGSRFLVRFSGIFCVWRKEDVGLVSN